MDTLYNKAIAEVNRLALSGEKFSVEQAHKAILKNGGIFKTGFGESIQDYFEKMVDNGFFEHAVIAPGDRNVMYVPTPLFLNLAELCPDCVEEGKKIDVFAEVCKSQTMV